ncbi:MAG TPA: zf-HC2 domain-containing protein [Pyrinomonadaceae bacterium]|jgi:predicted anti-sigma-YlaC factor YlaD
MTEGFDKEIDALLRQTAKGETALAANNSEVGKANLKFAHLDADEISAFAENALPEKTRIKYVAHFADCDRCRKILSNVISLDSETKVVTEPSAVSPKIVAAANIPWYRRLFAFPNPAYALGALVVLLGGFLAFSIMQNGGDSRSAEISQVAENQPTASGPSAGIEPEFTISETMPNTNMTAGNMNTTATSSNSAAIGLSNASTAASANNSAQQRLNANSSGGNTASEKKETTSTQTAREAQKTVTENDAETRQTVTTADSATGNQVLNSKQTAEEAEDSEKLRTAAAPPAASLAKPASPAKADNKDKRLAKNLNAESSNEANKQIGGKTFNRRDGVWYDSAYSGQSTINVSRGSEEYKKSDSGLRSIADNLGGTVVVIWKNKAYRIQ